MVENKSETPYELLGRVSESYNVLDANLIALACRLLDANQPSTGAFAGRLNIRFSGEFIKAWQSEVDAVNANPKPEWFRKLDDIRSCAAGLDGERNQFLHSIYRNNPFGGGLLAARVRDYGASDIILHHKVDDHNLDRFVKRCTELSKTIADIVEVIPPHVDPMASDLVLRSTLS